MLTLHMQVPDPCQLRLANWSDPIAPPFSDPVLRGCHRGSRRFLSIRIRCVTGPIANSRLLELVAAGGAGQRQRGQGSTGPHEREA